MSIFKLSLIGLGARIVLLGMSLINTALLARFLEPEGRGQYFLFQTVLVVLAILGGLGLPQSARIFSAKYEEQTGHIHKILLQSVLLQWLVVGLVGGGLWFFGGHILLPNFHSQWLGLGFVALPLALYGNVWNGMMIGLSRIWELNAVQLISAPIHLTLLGIFIVKFSGDVEVALKVYLAILLLQSLMMAAVVLRIPSQYVEPQLSTELRNQMWSFGFRGYLNSVSSLLWVRIPVFLLNSSHGVVAVGIYSVAQQVAEKVVVPVQALQDAIYRRVTTLSKDEAVQALNRYLRIALWGLLFVVGVGVALANPIILFVFGESYQDGTQVLQVLLLGISFSGVSIILSAFILGQLGRPGLLSYLAALNVLVCLGGGILLIPRFGEIGAALSLLFTQVVGSLVVFGVYLKLTGARLKDAIFLKLEDVTLVWEESRKIIWRKRQIKEGR